MRVERRQAEDVCSPLPKGHCDVGRKGSGTETYPLQEALQASSCTPALGSKPRITCSAALPCHRMSRKRCILFWASCVNLAEAHRQRQSHGIPLQRLVFGARIAAHARHWQGPLGISIPEEPIRSSSTAIKARPSQKKPRQTGCHRRWQCCLQS